ncbi:pyridoxal 5'-phosphate synthase glutaminase subunit PdxT [Candidatus Peregrinibacteria bacterium CG10_big_fil_rev_8_21_14_0_10_36_19]|nr:MAG: pyridoxal 5'-phosphate synthase glutaminase subunit PdxT [Candidatus Peregrinibacteria bacterium CG10_big_fil_rev_8_21_14_0_10_36_19]
MKIGVLDIQGSVDEHIISLKKLGVHVVRVKKPEDLEGLKGLIIPGGESTTIGKLLKRFGLGEEIAKKVQDGMAIWGTCAGAILLANQVIGGEVDGLNLIDAKVQRNAYGRQIDSFETKIEFANTKIPAVFIRAPKILNVGDGVEILSKLDGEIVAAKKDKIVISTFHPELTDSTVFHQWFLELCEQ